MAAATMRGSPDIANGNSDPRDANGTHPASGSRRDSTALPETMDYNDDGEVYEPAAAEGRKKRSAPKAASNTKSSGRTGRSFSARARDLPVDNSNYTTRKSSLQTPPGLSEESTTPRGLPPAEYLQNTNTETQQNEGPLPEAPTAPASIPSAPSRSNTTHSTSGPRKDWASDRSPLQKLEVTLSGISKEEKRARVQEAEMRLKERMARQKAEREKAEAEAVTPATAQPSAEQNAPSNSRAVPGSARKGERKNVTPGEATINAPAAVPRQPMATAARHNRAVSMNPQYPAIRRPDNAQYTLAENTIPPSVQVGNVPRRSVTMNGPSAKHAPAGEDIARSKSLSQKGPSEPIQPSDVILSEERLETPPAARTAQDSVESHTKKRQTVSFNVPPPTPPPIFEWKNAPIARLGSADFDFQHLDMDRSKAWWEGGTNNRRKSRALPKNYKTPAQKLTGKLFKPRSKPVTKSVEILISNRCD